MNYILLTEELVSKALKSGAHAAEVYLETSRNLSVQIREGEIETIEEASTAGIGFRVIVDGKMGFSHCNDLTTASLDDTIQKAISFARLTTADENNVLPANTPDQQVEGLFDSSILSVPMEKKIQMATELEKLAMKGKGITKSSGSGYGESDGEVFIANSNGLKKNYRSSGCSLGVSVVAEKDDQKNTGGEYCTRRYFGDLLSLEEIAAEAARKAVELIDPEMVKTQRASVIFDSDVAFSLLGGIIAAINGERVLQGASFLKNSLDKAFASALLTIMDDGLLVKGLGSAPFDGEGVACQKRILVDKGVLKGFLYNTITAKRAGAVATGNASRGGFNSLPGIGVHNLYVEAGQSTPQQIIQSTNKGLWVKEVTGYGINPVTGNFSGGASGLWIENGVVKHPVKGLTIAGNASDILNAIDMMGNDLDLTRARTSPTFRVAEMQIGGK
jgi:PmbA protein